MRTGTGPQPNGAGTSVQGDARHACGTLLRATLLCTALTGCSSFASQINPVNWWHDLEGGKVAEQRPPPPAADAPYPNLATVPPKPAPPDPAQRVRIADALIADRANAHYAAAQAPLPDPSSRRTSPALFGGAVPPPPPVDPDASSASLPAASAPPAPATHPFATTPAPAPATPPSRAPRTAVSSAPLPPPAEGAAAVPPTIPDAPPPAPALPGVGIPATAATPPPVAPPSPVQPRAATAGDRVPVAFAPGSAVLPPGAEIPLRRLVTIGKGAAGIAIIGYGDSNGTSPDAQTAGVNLGLLRAHAIAAVFTAAGIPSDRLRLDSQAAGTGGEARLVN